MAKRFGNLGLIQQCDAFPYASSPDALAAMMASLYTVVWADSASDGAYAIGYMRRSVFAELASIAKDDLQAMGLDATVDLEAEVAVSGTVPLHRLLSRQATEPGRTAAMEALCQYWRSRGTFRLLRGWRDELWPVYGRGTQGAASAGAPELLFSMERAAMGLLGTTRYGVHMTAYVPSAAPEGPPEGPPGPDTGLRIWVPKRAADKSTYPSMLDNTVAGGLMTGEDPFECLVREADEEASLPEALVRRLTRPAGTISYISITDERAGGEPGYVYPEVEWAYDLPLPADVVPLPKDGEVESFQLCSVAQVRDLLAQGLFKPNCAVVTIDFLIRHGLLTLADEPALDAILGRLHRKLPFPVPPDVAQP